MIVDDGLARALAAAGFGAEVTAARDLTGGCIHRVRRLTLSDGTTLVAKFNHADQHPLFEEEAVSLRTLGATGTVLVPDVLAVVREAQTAVLFMTALDPVPAGGAQWRRFGEELAALHSADSTGSYGFETDNHLGTTPQPNGWCDDWVRFNAERRLGHQLTRAAGRNLLQRDEARRVEGVIDRLDSLIPARPRPALLHGDLWSGNALGTADGAGTARIAIVDPACSWGDGWADIAMMQLFGGFPEACFETYAACVGEAHQLESRLAVYQLYHVLNHVNLFGRGYVAQAMGLARRLGA